MSSPLTSLSAWSEDEEEHKQSAPPVKFFDLDQLRAALVRYSYFSLDPTLIACQVIMRHALRRISGAST